MQNGLEKYKKNLVDIGYLIPEDQEEAYCKENGLKLIRMPNGSKVIAAQELTSHRNNTDINYYFNSGSYFDRKGKKGEHHFLEHLVFSSLPRDNFKKNLIDYNAYVNSRRTWVYTGGTLNADYIDFGVVPAIKDTFETLSNPSNLNNKKVYNREKSIILSEIEKDNGDYRTQIWNKFDSVVLADDNYRKIDNLGTFESVNSIKLDDLKQLHNEVFGYKNLLVQVNSKGKGTEYETAVNKVCEEVLQLSNPGIVRPFDILKSSKLRKLTGLPIRETTSIKNSLVYIGYAWHLKIEPYTIEDYSANFMLDNLLSYFFENNVRDAGLSYVYGIFYDSFLPDNRVVVFYIQSNTINCEEDLKKLGTVITKTFNDLLKSKNVMKQTLESEKMRQRAVPISQEDKLSHFIGNLIDFGLIGNAMKTREQKMQISIEYFVKLLNDFKNNKPVDFMIGDI